MCVCVLLKHIHCWIHHSYFLSSKRNLNRKLKISTSSCPFNKSNKSKGEALNSCYCHHLSTFFNNTTLSNWQRTSPEFLSYAHNLICKTARLTSLPSRPSVSLIEWKFNSHQRPSRVITGPWWTVLKKEPRENPNNVSLQW